MDFRQTQQLPHNVAMWPKGLGFDSRWLQVLSLGYGGVCHHHWWFRNDENLVCTWEARHWVHMAREMLKAKGLLLISSTWKMLITLWEINVKPRHCLWRLLGSTLLLSRCYSCDRFMDFRQTQQLPHNVVIISLPYFICIALVKKYCN